MQLPSTEQLLSWFEQHPAATHKTTAMAAVCRSVAALPPRPNLDAVSTSESDAQTRQKPPASITQLATADQIAKFANVDDPEEAFWATNALYLTGGDPWKQWQQHLKQTVTTQSDSDGEHIGTWPPSNGLGRTECTALYAMTLQAYYRYSCLFM